ncbi:MAG: putative glycosyltransferase [Nitrospira sp.]|jgi:lipopolysaccharide/colanic/teichoic acid biosynthesis glycosyltransferase/GT2 family glycosyltransferase|nr:putative glycosyltransferase [Nitrospira sp.]
MLNKEQHPSVAVIIPCRNEAAFIGRCLGSIVANPYPADRLDILVLDGVSQDGTRAVVERFAESHPHIRLIDNPAGTIPAAMNLGIRRSSSQVVMKVDAHSTYPPDYIEACVRYLFAYPADMVGGVCSITPRNGTFMAEAIAASLSHRFASGNAYIKIGAGEPRWADAAAFGCWRRDTLERLGSFDERLAGSSDMDLNRRLRSSGGKILLAPQIRVTYYADADLKSFWAHNFSDGVWTTYVLKFGKQASSWRHWIPFAWVVLLVVLGMGMFLDWRFAWALAAAVASYAFVALALSVQFAVRRKNARYLWTLPLVFAVRHVAHGCGAMYGLVLAALPGVSWRGRRADADRQEYPGRRAFDLLGALAGLLLFAPLAPVLTLLIKLDSRGPVLYRGDRLGKYGKPFRMIKFRTMCLAAEQGAPITPEGDRRVTRVGRFLRKYKLDELPQLLNVLKGDMSLVGPRPECEFYFQYYSAEEKRLVHSVRPGMTDYGSLRFHDEGALLAGSSDPVQFYVDRIRQEKVREQLRYIREQSLMTDLKIILRTVATIVTTRMKPHRTGLPAA